jgi:TIR domain
LPGRGRAGVQVLPGRLPELRERVVPALHGLTQSVTAINHSEDSLIPKDWDVFISHASEDKDEVVRPLAYELQERGLRVWFDESELRIGDSLRRKIDQGIAQP